MSFILYSQRDEAHFGKFASFYLKRSFYHDVHPPLAKMLNGLAGYIARYDGSFEFKSGDVYPDSVDFVTMRVFNAIFGALLVPMAYYTAIQLHLSQPAAVFMAVLVLGGILLLYQSFRLGIVHH